MVIYKYLYMNTYIKLTSQSFWIIVPLLRNSVIFERIHSEFSFSVLIHKKFSRNPQKSTEKSIFKPFLEVSFI